MRISALRLKHLPPFEDVMMEFPKKSDASIGEVQIITGQNGTGKTRLLCAMASILGNPKNLQIRIADTPNVEFGAVVEFFEKTYLVWGLDGLCGTIERGNSTQQFQQFDPKKPQLHLETQFRLIRQVSKSSNQPSSALAFRGTAKVNDAKVEAMKPIPIGDFANNLDFEANDQSTFILQAMTNLKMAAAMEFLSKQDGETNPKSRSIQITSRLEGAVSKVSGKTFSFEVVPHPELRIRVRWGGVQMSFGALPDGLRSIIGWLVACASRMAVEFPENESPLDIPVVLLVDEPETHLHPAWQQRLIPAAQILLPNSQIFVVTHSPFIISSVNSGFVHVLSEQEGKISVSEPMECSKGDTWVDAVEDALGLKTWYDPETETMLADFRKLRQDVLSENGDIGTLQSLAGEISSRSESLSQMMGREMYQLRQIIEGTTARR